MVERPISEIQYSDVAYTIGVERAYDEALLDTCNPPKKLGKKGDDYEGGWVWRDAKSALMFIGSPSYVAAFGAKSPTCAVYELLLPATWNVSVSALPARDGVHRLLMDARIVRKALNAE